MKIVKNGTVVFENEVRPADILIDQEKIVEILEPNTYVGDAEVIDATGLHVMAGTIDPHMHLGLYKPLADAFRYDTPRQAIGGLTTLINYHRGKGNYFETAKEAIKDGEENSLVDFALSLGLCAKVHLEQIEGFIKELGITTYKFFFDKQDIAHLFYDIPKEEALTLDKADLYFILKQLREISPKLMLCVHCEDPDVFRALERKLKEDGGSDTLESFEKTRPTFVETACVADSMWFNHVVDGNMYVVHTAAGSTVKMYETLQKEFPSRVTLETCPQYLTLTNNAKCGLLGKVNPPLHSKSDIEALWEGIKNGSIKTMGTDNVPVDIEKKYERGNDLWGTYVGFGGPGMILPVLISEGYHKRGISLSTLSQVNSINTARAFGLESKGEIAVGKDADLALVDLNWEREITKDLFGYSDFSIYEGMTFKGWPRYTISRGEIIQKDGKITAECGRGKYLKRTI